MESAPLPGRVKIGRSLQRACDMHQLIETIVE
jgi:hypothetical protein